MTKKIKKQDKTAKKLCAQDSLKDELQQAQQSAQDNWDKLLRAQAEIQNLKRRHDKDLENTHKFALYDFAKTLLEVNDSLIMGLKAAKEEKATAKQLKEGLALTNKIFLSTLEKFGVAMINPINEAFNPELHEAVAMLAAPKTKSNTVLTVAQVGFTLNDRLLRPAMVTVAQ